MALFYVRLLSVLNRKNGTRMAYRCQERAIERRVEHLRDVRRRVRKVELDLAQLLVPERDRLRLDVLEARAANLSLGVRARLLERLERHADADRDLLWVVRERDERAGLVHTPDEVAREVERGDAEPLRVEAVAVACGDQAEVIAQQGVLDLRVGSPDTELIQSLIATVQKVVARERLIIEASWAPADHVAVSVRPTEPTAIHTWYSTALRWKRGRHWGRCS